jgi:diadenosine tetraphosphate (Ap4A) HIT family hydrolase
MKESSPTISHRKLTHTNCLFCDLIEDQDLKEKEGYRILKMTPDYIAILDSNPKVPGHTLVISTKQLDDVTELNSNSKHAKILFRGIIETSKLLKKKLTGKEGKVYVMTMCEHWQPDEIESSEKQTTEHLHFHLLPRYPHLRTRKLAMENLFCRDGVTWSHVKLKKLSKRILS